MARYLIGSSFLQLPRFLMSSLEALQTVKPETTSSNSKKPKLGKIIGIGTSSRCGVAATVHAASITQKNAAVASLSQLYPFPVWGFGIFYNWKQS